ncbi:MAG TPA: GAF domain-containing protein [Thermomicrobiales bacterium]|nr:GAF domain-containing protein [Thermomicrobiales bacterium]
MKSDAPKMTLLPQPDRDSLFRPETGSSPRPWTFQTAVGRAADAFIGGGDPENVLQDIAVSVTRALGCDISLIRTLSPDGQNFVITTAAGPAPLSIGGLIGSYSVLSDALKDIAPGTSTAVDLRSEADTTRLMSNERWEFEHIGGHHLLMVPLFAAGTLVGRMDLVRTTDDPFSSETRGSVTPFAAYAAGVLRDRQLRHSNEERHVFQTVVRLHESVEQLADPETILQAVVELIVREPGCDRCYAMLWNADRGEFVPTAVAGLEPHLVDILKLISLSPQLVPAFDQMVHSSRPLVIADATKSTLLPASLVRALGIRAAMIVPLRGRRRQTMGVLLLDYAEVGRQFTDAHAAMLSGISQHLSTIIESAILFEEMRTSSDSMSIINEIAIQLAMLTDEDSLFRQLYFHVGSVLDASRFALGLLTGDQRSLDVRVAIDGEIVPGKRRVAIGEDPLSTAVISGRAELVGIRGGMDERDWLCGAEPDDPSHSHLTVPVTVGRNVIGAVTIQSTFRNAYGPRDKELLAAVALHTGIAIENARLYRIVRSRGDRRAAVLDQVIHRHEAERKELVDDIHDDTLQTLAACLYRLDQAQSAVARLDQREPALAQLSDVRESLAENIDRLRQRIFALRPAMLDRLGLAPAVRDLLSRSSREHGFETELDVVLPSRLAPDDETLIFRLIQDAIDHLRGREGLTSIQVSIRAQSDSIQVAIQDDGASPVSPNPDDASDYLDMALVALIERVDLAGGNTRVSNRAAGGSVIQISIPERPRGDVAPSFEFPDPATNVPEGLADVREEDHSAGD